MEGWFSAFFVGACLSWEYFWSTDEDQPQIDPRQENNKGHKKVWRGAAVSGPAVNYGGKWSAFYYWEISIFNSVQKKKAFVTVEPLTGEFEDGTPATVEGD